MLAFCLSALRAVIELMIWSLLAQVLLALIAGRQRRENTIYRFFSLLTTPPRRLLACCLPTKTPTWLLPLLTFIALLGLWLGLALARKLLIG